MLIYVLYLRNLKSAHLLPVVYSVYVKSVLKPMKQVLDCLPYVKARLEKRRRRKLDFDSYCARAEQYKGKPEAEKYVMLISTN